MKIFEELGDFFTEEEKKHWNRILERLSNADWFIRIKSYVTGKTEDLQEKDVALLAQELEPLLNHFVPIPFGSRLLNPNLVNDLLARYILEMTGAELNELYRFGNMVQETVKMGKTWLTLPREIFTETDFKNLLLLLGATVLYLPKRLNQTLGLLAQHTTSILRGASENEKFAQVLFRHGILDINDDNTFTVHFDRFIIALGDPTFIEESSEFILQYVPMETFYGPQSIMGIALSRSIANGLFAAAVAAKQANQQERFVNMVAKLQEKVEKIHSELSSLQPDWTAISDNLNEIFDNIDTFTEKAEREFPHIFRITQEAGEVGLYPDIILEASGLATKEFSSHDWEWLERTQQVAIRTAAQVKPLYRQPIYWLALSCLRLATMPNGMVEKLKKISSQLATGEIWRVR